MAERSPHLPPEMAEFLIGKLSVSEITVLLELVDSSAGFLIGRSVKKGAVLRTLKHRGLIVPFGKIREGKASRQRWALAKGFSVSEVELMRKIVKIEQEDYDRKT